MQANRHLVLWDGECGMCSRFARDLQRRDTRSALNVVAYQHCEDPRLTDAIRAQCEHALHVIQSDDRVLKGADAVFFAYQVTGLPLALMRIPPLIWVAELGYRVIAANRYWFSKVLFTGDQGLNATCKVELQDPDSPS